MTPQKVIFVDRDGTINQDPGYISDVKDFCFIDGVSKFLKIFQSFGYKVVIVTNQGGVAKGKFTKDQSIKFSDHVVQQLLSKGVCVEQVLSCFHHPHGSVEPFNRSCSCRKPKPGLLHQAEDQFQIDKDKSVILGNALTDIQAGLSFGLNVGFLLNINGPNQTTEYFEDTLKSYQRLYTSSDYSMLLELAEHFLRESRT